MTGVTAVVFAVDCVGVAAGVGVGAGVAVAALAGWLAALLESGEGDGVRVLVVVVAAASSAPRSSLAEAGDVGTSVYREASGVTTPRS